MSHRLGRDNLTETEERSEWLGGSQPTPQALVRAHSARRGPSANSGTRRLWLTLVTGTPSGPIAPSARLGGPLPGAGEGSAEDEQGQQVADRRGVARYRHLWRRVRQGVLAAAGRRGQA